MPSNKRGYFLTFEGCEGSGKSTQAFLLAEILRAEGIDVVITREPGGSPGAEIIRDLLVKGEVDQWDAVTEALLFMAARRNHLVNIIWPALRDGKWVICDRFVDSSFAFQGYGHGLSLDHLKSIYHMVGENFYPDLTILLDVDPVVGLERTQHRDHDENRFERMSMGFHTKVYEGYHELAKEYASRYIIIDSQRKEVEETTAEIWRHIEKRLLHVEYV